MLDFCAEQKLEFESKTFTTFKTTFEPKEVLALSSGFARDRLKIQT